MSEEKTNIFDRFVNSSPELQELSKQRVKQKLNEEITVEEAKSLGNEKLLAKVEKRDQERLIKEKNEAEVNLIKEKLDSDNIDLFFEGAEESFLKSTKNLKAIEDMETQFKDKLHDLEMAKLKLEEFLGKCTIIKGKLQDLKMLEEKTKALKEGVTMVKEHTSMEDLDLSKWWGEDLTEEERKQFYQRNTKVKAPVSIQEAYNKVWEDKEKVKASKEQTKANQREQDLQDWDTLLEE